MSDITLQRLWNCGLGNLTFLGRNSTGSDSRDPSSHAAAQFCEKKFEMISKCENLFDELSLFLLTMKDQGWSTSIVFSNEAEIFFYIRHILRDVLISLEIFRDVYLSSETDWVVKKSSIWVVRTQSDVPIAVIVVKQPGVGRISQECVLGEVFDYLATLRNSFGQCEVFGIVTTLEEWRVCWLPDTDSFAASSEERFEDAEFSVRTTLERTLSCSQVYQCNDPDLLKVIGSFLKKSLKSHNRQVPLISSNRGYVILNELNWCWGSYSDADLQSFASLSLALPNALQIEIPHFTVLRQFHGGADGQVFLALTNDFRLVVIKKFTESDKCDKECRLWREVNGVDVLKVTLVGSPCLIMPFVFPCCEIADGEIVFNFDLSSLGKVRGSSILDDDRFNVWMERIKEFIRATGDISVQDTLDEAVDEFTRKCYYHDDLEWRHVALLPQVSTNGEEIVGMKPVLIDLASVKRVETQEIAMTEMQSRVHLICPDPSPHRPKRRRTQTILT
jgi:hypothetical protein